MKVRTGFVSNSSSSSFTCSVCGCTESGWDLCLDDSYMYGCANGHYYCEGHGLKFDAEELRKDVIRRETEHIDKLENDPEYKSYRKGEERKAYIKECKKEIIKIEGMPGDQLIEDYSSGEGGNSRYEYTPLACPICQYKQTNNGDALTALKKEYNLTEEEVLEIVKKHMKY